MNNEAYKTTFYSAVRELADLQDEKNKLEERQSYVDERVVKLRETIRWLGELLDDNSYKELVETRPELFSDAFDKEKTKTSSGSE
jgi:hypothetical protein